MFLYRAFCNISTFSLYPDLMGHQNIISLVKISLVKPNFFIPLSSFMLLIVLYIFCMNKLSSTKILITVGTTEFDALVEYADSTQFMSLVGKAGFNQEQVAIQYGTTGKYVPSHVFAFRLHPNIQQIYSQHEVVITHGGAGTLLACLCDPSPKKIIAVANNTLAGNHQTELITKLHQLGYILGFNSVDQMKQNTHLVLQLLKGETKLKKYERANKSVINSLVFGEDY